jgi:hypothetical protein
MEDGFCTVPALCEVTVCFMTYQLHKVYFRVKIQVFVTVKPDQDPDPHGSALTLKARSGSGIEINADPQYCFFLLLLSYRGRPRGSFKKARNLPARDTTPATSQQGEKAAQRQQSKISSYFR